MALGVHHGLPSDHMDLANELVKTCYQTYAIQPTFLAPEITYFNIQVMEIISILIKLTIIQQHGILKLFIILYRIWKERTRWICT